MKKINVILFVFIAGTIAFSPLKAQMIVDVGNTNTLFLGGETVPTDDFVMIITPSGNITFNATWYLDLSNSFVPSNGVNKVMLITMFNGEQCFAESKINSNGKVHVVFNVNQGKKGSFRRIPPGNRFN